MGILNRKIQKKALQIDLRRWAMVDSDLERGEEPRLNTPCKLLFDEGHEDGYVFLTDRALYLMIGQGESVLRLPFERIKLAEPQGGTTFLLGYEAPDGSKHRTDVQLYPSPLSNELWGEFMDALEEAHR